MADYKKKNKEKVNAWNAKSRRMRKQKVLLQKNDEHLAALETALKRAFANGWMDGYKVKCGTFEWVRISENELEMAKFVAWRTAVRYVESEKKAHSK